MSEKRKPSHDLVAIQAASCKSDGIRMTTSAVRGAAEMGMVRADVLRTIRELKPSDFYKSMTSYADHRSWQDVYHARSPQGTIYVKLTADGTVAEFALLSFKEK